MYITFYVTYSNLLPMLTTIKVNYENHILFADPNRYIQLNFYLTKLWSSAKRMKNLVNGVH